MAIPAPKRITELDLATPLVDADLLVVVQGNRTKRTRISAVKEALETACECTLVSRYTTVGTDANTTKKYLYTYTLPANTLNVDGSWLEIHAAGLFAANGNNKLASVDIKQDTSGLNQISSTTNSAFNDDYWSIDLRIQRSSQTTYQIHKYVSVVGNAVSLQTPAVLQTVGDVTSMDWSDDLQICVTGTNGTANANDITCLQFIVRANLLDANS